MECVEYRLLTTLDVSAVKNYLSDVYPDINILTVRGIVNKTLSIGGFSNGRLTCCYLLDINIYGINGPEVLLEYIKVEDFNNLRTLLSAVAIFYTFDITLNNRVKEHIGVSCTSELISMCYSQEASIKEKLGMKDKKIIAKFKRGLQLEFYSNSDKLELIELIREYHMERNIDVFIDSEESLRTISDMLEVKKDEVVEDIVIVRCTRYNKIVGYTRYTIINEYGAVPSYLYGEYIYITPSYRNGLASTVLFGFLCNLSSVFNMYIKWDVYTNTNNANIAYKFFKAEKYMEGFKLLPEETSKFADTLYLRHKVIE